MHTRLGWAALILLVYACGGSTFEGFEEPPDASAGVAGTLTTGGGKTGSGGAAAGASSSGAPAEGTAGASARGGSTGRAGEGNVSGGGANESGMSAGARAGASNGGEPSSAGSGATSGGVSGQPSGGSGDAGSFNGGSANGGASGGAGGEPAHRCPPKQPKAQGACMPDGVRCTYSGLNACLCTPVDPYTCQQDDPKCNALPSSFAAPPAEGGSGNRIVIPVAYTTCTCSTSEWQCSVVRP